MHFTWLSLPWKWVVLYFVLVWFGTLPSDWICPYLEFIFQILPAGSVKTIQVECSTSGLMLEKCCKSRSRCLPNDSSEIMPDESPSYSFTWHHTRTKMHKCWFKLSRLLLYVEINLGIWTVATRVCVILTWHFKHTSFCYVRAAIRPGCLFCAEATCHMEPVGCMTKMRTHSQQLCN